jgi:methionine-rich copper-binding protein CopC
LAAAASAVACLLVFAGPALGHGDLEGTSPADGSKVGKPPSEIRVTLTEAPTRGAEAVATDGCKRKVPAAVSVDGSDIVLSLQGGERGKWKVTYQAVSSVDGHQTRGKFAFTVSGKKDCSRDEPDEPEDDVDAGDDPGIIENPNPPDEGISWLVWAGGGTILLVGLAFVVRRSGR